MGWLGLLLLIIAALVLLLRGDAGSIAGLDTGEFAALTAGVALLIFIGIPALRSYQGRIAQGVKDAATWAAFALVLVALYSFRAELATVWNRVAGELLPPGSNLTIGSGNGEQKAVRIRKRPDGHFAANTDLLLLIIAALVLLLRGDAGSIAGLDTGEFAALTAGVALLIFIGIPALRSYQGRIAQGVKDAATWAAFALVLVALYSFRAELATVWNRVAGELLPPGSNLTIGSGNGEQKAVRIRKRPDGHFAANTIVNRVALTMLVDTGASSVVLKNSDARRIGINVSALRYTIPVQTANGLSYAAPITLDMVAIGPIKFNRVRALVSKPGTLNESLLGMSFLTRLRTYNITGDFLTLRI